MKSTIMFLIPLLRTIMPLLCIALFIIVTPYIVELYSILNSILGQYISLAVKVLFLVILFLVKVLLMIRKANKSNYIYDKFFCFAANHYSSGILYFCIFLLSVGLVYFCGFDCNYGCTISCDLPLMDFICL